MRLTPLPLIWSPTCPFRDDLKAALRRWEGTPYAPDQQAPGVGVDCVRFVCGVLDSLTGRVTEPKTLPQDAALHDRQGAVRAMREIMALYQPFDTVEHSLVQGGDVLVVGSKSGGPGHAMIVGFEKNTLWHATHPRVQRTGMYLSDAERLFRVYRLDMEAHRGSE